MLGPTILKPSNVKIIIKIDASSMELEEFD